MIVTERVVINETPFTHTYSDAKKYIAREEVVYEEAYDPIDSGRTYTETDVPIDRADEEAAYAEAGRILMGVIE
jgi:TPP-dependent pyruvate/acetoin dehydrogenase alpha subunit